MILKNSKVSWEQSRNFKGSPGDEVIFFKFSNGVGIFTSLYKIEEVISKPQEKINNTKFNVEVKLIEEKNYEEDIKEFSDYIYSFPRVRNFGSNLWRHFNRKYYRISELEFDAITKDEIFLSRTFVGSTVNALHEEHRKAFVIYLIESNPEYLFGKYDYQNLYTILKTYLDFSILRPSRQLKSGFTDLVTIIGKSDADEAIFYSEFAKNENRINEQVNIIDSKLEVVENFDSLDFPFEKRQEKFERYFKNASLPFNLN